MQQKIEEDVKSNVSNQDLKIDGPRTRAFIKQENEDTKESLKCALYSPVKIEAPSLKISKYKSSFKNKYCSICNITFKQVKSFLDHELHSHKTKEIPTINLKTRCCNVCNEKFKSTTAYRKHMADLNNIRVPFVRKKPDRSKIPDANDRNNYCMSCNYMFKTRYCYITHLISIHHTPRPKLSRPRRNPENMKPTIDIISLYCDTCKIIYDSKKSYIQHLVELHEIVLPPKVCSELTNFDSSSLYCGTCDITYVQKYHFLRHLRRIHRTSLPFCPDLTPNINDKNNHCIVCDITLYNRRNYLIHLSALHLEENPKLYQGIDCKNPSKREITLKKYCADCHKVFLLKSLYYIHLDKIHGIKPLNYFPTVNNPDVNNPYNHCNLCDKTFQKRDPYRKHMAGVHNMLATITNRNTTPVVNLLKKYCNACDRVYKTMQSYRGHFFKYHPIEFGLIESSSSCVNRNTIPAIDEINSVCTACNKTYVNRVTYKIHLRNIHGIILPGSNRNALQVNRDIIPDFNDKRNNCASCNKTYSCRSNYKRHLAIIHDMREKNIKQEDQNEASNIRSVQTN